MKFTLTPTTFILIFFLSIVLLSCKKSSNECPATRSITIQNGPVIEGVGLQLEAEFQSTDYLYKWDGPNGWHYESADSNAYRPTRENMTAADTGEYKLQLVRNNCIEYEGSIRIAAVTPQPVPPCTFRANSSSSVDPYQVDYFYIQNYFGPTADHTYYQINGHDSNRGGHFLVFQFLGGNAPLPGTYKTSATLNEPGKVQLFIAFNWTFNALPDQTVYITKVNNKLEASFCSLTFNAPTDPTTLYTVSGRLVQP